eukprot:CAMPEP_0203703576 /NCGR_PEP_ID=MMETSP0091-20130426/43669_1 /ASSEMBLY_ACC=CAM_ASM_001089 /TAXON_ID=426623 /ORGANISM="Chaetoceros affinis, Strain CCMP159" /LENGTH=389 /DNA_ID=CAMNT_0050578279 /DNA_START=333 /DNA_END=1502 /DNA_ORIENTATION=-
MVMTLRRLSLLASVLGCVIILTIGVHKSQHGTNITEKMMSLSAMLKKEKKGNVLAFDGIENCEWCKASEYPPLPYDKCKHKDFLFRFGVYGGLTNALHFLLKGAVWAFEEDICFFVDERGPIQSRLAARDPPQENIDPFLERYFEPIGLPRNHKMVQKAFNQHLFAEPGYHQIQYHEYGKFSGGILPRNDPIRHKKRDIESLYSYGKDNIWTKKWMLRRLFRILPKMRDTACTRLKNHGLNEKYIAMSIRRGDKALEFELASSLQPYIDKAEIAIRTHFGGTPPKIFVASDDCSVMQEVRDLRPTWTFVGECDNASEDNGFVIAETKHWSVEQTDKHYEKFITEMIALASASYFIGISNTNVALFVYFMRHFDATDDTWIFVDGDKIPH